MAQKKTVAPRRTNFCLSASVRKNKNLSLSLNHNRQVKAEKRILDNAKNIAIVFGSNTRCPCVPGGFLEYRQKHSAAHIRSILIIFERNSNNLRHLLDERIIFSDTKTLHTFVDDHADRRFRCDTSGPGFAVRCAEKKIHRTRLGYSEYSVSQGASRTNAAKHALRWCHDRLGSDDARREKSFLAIDHGPDILGTDVVRNRRSRFECLSMVELDR